MEKESRPPNMVEEMAPGQVPEAPDEAQPSRTATFVDTRQDGEPRGTVLPPSPRGATREEMVEQEEVPFPMTSEKTRPQTAKKTASPKKSKNKQEVKVTEQTFEFEGRDFGSLDPKEYGIHFDEEPEQYDPPVADENLPDIYRLMASLEEGENQLDVAKQPPSLYTRPEQANYYKKITEKKTEIEEGSDIEDYLNNFLEGVRDDVLMIGQISLEEVQEEERRLRDEHISYMEQQKRIEHLIKQKIMILEEEAKKRIAYYLREKRTMTKRMEQLGQQRERLMLDRLNKAFRRSEQQLVAALERRKAEIKRYYGDLTEAEGHYGGSKGRRWKVDWDKTPQPIQIKLSCLRGVKDKLPHGRYVLMVSLYNRLGGHVLRWSNLRGQYWGGATLPVGHDGHFYNIEMKLDQSVFTVLPSKSGVRPGMVLVFELFLLRGSVVPTDRVVGWGCFPVADSQFDVVEGKFKCPFLRGEIDPLIDKHEKVEGLMASELDHWLCNCYFEIVKLPRYLAGQKEYEVELQFSSGMIAFPDRIHTNEEYKDGEAPIPGSLETVATSSGQVSSSRAMFNSTNLLDSSQEDTQSGSQADSLPKKVPLDEIMDYDNRKMSKKEEAFSDIRLRRPFSAVGSKKVHMEKKQKLIDSDGSDYEEEEVYLMKKDEDFYPVRGQPGLWYKRYEYNPVDQYHKKLYSLLPKTPVLTERRKRRKLTHLEQLEQHSFSVRKILSDKGHIPREGMEKMQYVGRQLLAELGLSQWRSREFWGMLLMFILTFFLRIYIHYIFQWLLLQALELPVTNFNFLPYTVDLIYQNSLLLTREELSIVLLGPFGNIFVFLLFVLTSWIVQKVLGGFPDIGSKFVISVGIQAFLDPFLILMMDGILMRHEDRGGDYPIMDAAKLYYNFERGEGNGLLGILVTIFLYFFTCFAAGSILYMYFLRLHNNGRMLDIYWRLHGNEEIFFMPYDLEVSNQELAYISRKSEQWRGEEGERRKVAVYDYIWEEEDLDDDIWDENASIPEEKKKSGKRDMSKCEITTHVSVHTLHLDGLRELYRHFLRLPDGGICEVFGDMSIAGMDKDVKNALKQGAQNLENLMGSQSTVKPVSSSDGFGSIDSDSIKKGK